MKSKTLHFWGCLLTQRSAVLFSVPPEATCWGDKLSSNGLIKYLLLLKSLYSKVVSYWSVTYNAEHAYIPQTLCLFYIFYNIYMFCLKHGTIQQQRSVKYAVRNIVKLLDLSDKWCCTCFPLCAFCACRQMISAIKGQTKWKDAADKEIDL